jgi:hypothetical protein
MKLEGKINRRTRRVVESFRWSYIRLAVCSFAFGFLALSLSHLTFPRSCALPQLRSLVRLHDVLFSLFVLLLGMLSIQSTSGSSKTIQCPCKETTHEQWRTNGVDM